MVAQLLLEALCCFIVEFGIAGGTAALSSSNPLTDLSTSENRRLNSKSPKCAVDECNTLTFRSTDYCWKHQDDPPLDPDSESEQEPNWWEETSE